MLPGAGQIGSMVISSVIETAKGSKNRQKPVAAATCPGYGTSSRERPASLSRVAAARVASAWCVRGTPLSPYPASPSRQAPTHFFGSMGTCSCCSTRAHCSRCRSRGARSRGPSRKPSRRPNTTASRDGSERADVGSGRAATSSSTSSTRLSAYVLAEQRCGPVRYRHPSVFGGSTGLRFDARGVCVRERDGGRPERGASASFATGSSTPAKRAFHLKTVRTCTPRTIAMSPEPTPCAISSTASARLACRTSVVAGRIASSIATRCLSVRGKRFARGPGCGRFTHGSGSIMRRPIPEPTSSGQISAERY